ncbi:MULTISPECIES: hypothetical protein [Rufibacter]|uniref:DUF4180 domain-containing protein n=1 Tax=Rufibacter quisquiliarum TaxID=1549639 RepID=A0A839GKE4_9BACT|nr:MULTISPECIES: hypothetical protein [Rufibacter]MBA9075437.1 hypothetical protein [Rufibacter quisquiliarum]
MILYQSGFLTLDYDPATDILFVEWPDVHEFLVPEINQTLQILVDHLKSYDIKRLLVDASQAALEIPPQEYKEVLKEFGLNLMTTRLEKLARIITPNPAREHNVEEAKQEVGLTLRLQTFPDKQEALLWLEEEG